MISLITTDVGDTLGTVTKPRVKDILFDLSRIPAVDGKAWIFGDEERRFLHTRPELTSTVLCGFAPCPYTNRVLADLCQVAPVAALSNLSVLGATRMDDLERSKAEPEQRRHRSHSLPTMRHGNKKGGSDMDKIAPRRRLTGPAAAAFVQWAKAQYEYGAAIRTIAAASGRSYGAVHRTLAQAGVQFRRRGSDRLNTPVGQLRPTSSDRDHG